MAIDLFKLAGSIYIDTDKANESLQKTDNKASSFASTLGKVGGTALKIGGMVVGAATAIGGAAIGVANSVAESTDEIDKASIRMGISAESYQELAYVADQCGVSMSTMEQAAKKLEGTDLNFEDAINQIMSLGTAEERSAMAAELFGEKVAYNLSPMIEQSGESFDGLIQRANDLGLVMSGDAIENGVKFGDMLSDIKQMASSLANQFGIALFPIIIALFDEIIAFMPQVQGYMAQLTPVLVQIVSAILPILFELLQSLIPVAIELIQTLLPVAVELINSLLPLITALLPLISPIANLLLGILVPLTQMLSVILPPIIDLITQFINFLMPGIIAVINLVADVISNTLNAILNNLTPFFSNIFSMFEGLIEFLTGVFTGDWDKALEGITKVAKSWVNMILSYIQATINGAIEMVNILIDAALKVANLVPGVDIDTSTTRLPTVNIPMLAKGGIIDESGSAIVGERGAELLTLPKGASVSPLPSNDIDYDKLANSITNAIKDSLNLTIPVNLGNELLETVVVDALNMATYRSGGR